jgi:hypothetical protein
MSMTHEANALKSEPLQQELVELSCFLDASLKDGTALHNVEQGLWTRLLRLGHHCLQLFLAAQGTGDQGETVTLPTGQACRRLPKLHLRRYVSIFGVFSLARTAYGSREGQPLQFVPLDNRLQLPASDFSYLLQDWDQSLCVEEAFGQVRSTVARILNLKQPVDSLERMNQEMAQAVEPYRLSLQPPPPEAEGELFVVSADGKGVVMRRQAEDPVPAAHRTKGQKASQKRMATVGSVYSVERFVRTPEEVVAALFRERDQKKRPRPKPCGKRVWASLCNDAEPHRPSGPSAVYLWMLWELALRNPGQAKETVQLHDGQESLWEAAQQYLPSDNCVPILDILHVTPRLWQAAHLFHAEGSDEAEAFARERILKVLQGQASGVIRGLRSLGTRQQLTGAKKKTLVQVCGYLEKNLGRMRYDEYLAKGYPIASGVIEGACRHLVKDRLERAGMHWTYAGAQAMLDVRSVYVSEEWEAFQSYRIEQETQRLYPNRELVAGPNYTMAA